MTRLSTLLHNFYLQKFLALTCYKTEIYKTENNNRVPKKFVSIFNVKENYLQ